MRILVVGAGAVGGYFGGRLTASGQDVTFLVRSERAAKLATAGLTIKSKCGNVTIKPRTVVAGTLDSVFDVILLACKAYNLVEAIDALAPAVTAKSLILPLLNGMRHFDLLDERFGSNCVLGGHCLISTTLDPNGCVIHLNDTHTLAFGERDGKCSTRVSDIARGMEDANFVSQTSENIIREMWEKWVFLSAFAGITSLMRAPIGDIVAAGGAVSALGMLDECKMIATEMGYVPRPEFLDWACDTLTLEKSSASASMLRDIECGRPTECAHILGDIISRGEEVGLNSPLLRMAYVHLQAYESQRRQSDSGN